LQHPHPRKSKHQVLVDVNLLLQTMTAEKTRIGEWVNVIGYITASPSSARPGSLQPNHKQPEVHIQALVLWSTGPLDIDRYEASLEGLQEENGTSSS